MAEPTEGSFRIRITDGTSDGRTVEISRDRAALYTYFGALSIFDHVYLEFPAADYDEVDIIRAEHIPEGAQVNADLVGSYTFAQDPNYKVLMSFLAENRFPLYLNLREVSDADREAYIGQQMRWFDKEIGSPPEPTD